MFNEVCDICGSEIKCSSCGICANCNLNDTVDLLDKNQQLEAKNAANKKTIEELNDALTCYREFKKIAEKQGDLVKQLDAIIDTEDLDYIVDGVFMDLLNLGDRLKEVQAQLEELSEL